MTTLPALRTAVDFSLLHALRVRRLARERHASDKLALLRRLAEQTIYRTLPETRVEQSWNEQLFAKLLGYRTLLSHDVLPFHVLPKNAAGSRRFDDFSVGFFGVGPDEVLGTAELKSPGANLDAPQTSGNYNGQTPVEQAISTAAKHGASCRWVLVSNFRELRLYDMRAPDAALAVVPDLAVVRNRDDLALVCAHFDVAALLGEPGKDNAEMTAALDPDHLSHPLPELPGHCRLVIRIVREQDDALPLYKVEKALRDAAEAAFGALDLQGPMPALRIDMKDGWVATDSLPAVRLSASRFGEVQLSRVLRRGGASTPPILLALASLTQTALAFARAVAAFDRAKLGGSLLLSLISGELRDVKGMELLLEDMQEPGASPTGVCPAPEVAAGHFKPNGTMPTSLAQPLASFLCEIAVQFRSPNGGVGLNDRAVSTWLQQKLSQA